MKICFARPNSIIANEETSFVISNQDVSESACEIDESAARKTESYFPDGKIYLSRTGFFSSPFDSRSVNRAVSNVQGLKLKITAHKIFENKFGQIRAGIKFIYFRDRLQRISTANFNRTCSIFHAAMQANVFSIDKTHQHILLWRGIHSFVSIRSQLNTRALICVYYRIGRTQFGNYLFSDSKVSGTIACKTDSLHVHVFGLRPVCAVNFSRDQSSAKLINFLDSRLDTRN